VGVVEGNVTLVGMKINRKGRDLSDVERNGGRRAGSGVSREGRLG